MKKFGLRLTFTLMFDKRQLPHGGKGRQSRLSNYKWSSNVV
jgi:hypothetical protein